MIALLAALLAAAAPASPPGPAPARWWVMTPAGATEGPVTAAEFVERYGDRTAGLLVAPVEKGGTGAWVRAEDEPRLRPERVRRDALAREIAERLGPLAGAGGWTRFGLGLGAVLLCGLVHAGLMRALAPRLAAASGLPLDGRAAWRAAAFPGAVAVAAFVAAAAYAALLLPLLPPLLGALGLLAAPAASLVALVAGYGRVLGAPALAVWRFPAAAAAGGLGVLLLAGLVERLLL